MRLRHALFVMLLGGAPLQASEPLRIAVAASLLPVMQQIAHDYQQQNGQPVQLIGGSSGALFEQIRRGAPFDLFFSADAERANQLAAGNPQRNSSTYACGRLALWTPAARPALSALPPGKLAIAQPDTAPYGKAALQTLERSGLLAGLKPRLVYGQDVGQAFQFVYSGHASAGLVALSQLQAAQIPANQFSLIDPSLYSPLIHKHVLLNPDDDAADFRAFFASRRERLKAAGYALPGEAGCAAD